MTEVEQTALYEAFKTAFDKLSDEQLKELAMEPYLEIRKTIV